MIKLTMIYNLSVKLNKTTQDLISIVQLAYSLTSSGFRSVPLLEKISSVTGLAIKDIVLNDDVVIPENTHPFSLAWYIGLFLGDGDIRVRIRDVKEGLQFNPMFRIPQKNTPLNLALFNSLAQYLLSLGLNTLPLISEQGPNLVLQVYGKADVTTFINLLMPYTNYFF